MSSQSKIVLRLILLAGLCSLLHAQNISTFAGTGAPGVAGDLGPAINAQLNTPTGLALDAAGNLYIADTQNDRIRKVAPDGVITTAAGTLRGYLGDGSFATKAQLSQPSAVGVDSAGNLYILDTANSRVRRVTTVDGIITTIMGTGLNLFGGDGGPPIQASLDHAAALAVDSTGKIYIGEPGRIRVVSGNVINTVAGTGTLGYSGDGGTASSAMLNGVMGLAVDASGNLYIADSGNARIRKLSGTTITTIAGNGKAGFSGDGGPAASAQLNTPTAVAVDSAGNVYIADTGNNRIRKVAPDGTISTVAGSGSPGFSGDGGAATAAMLQSPSGVAVDSAGNLYISDTNNFRVRKLTSSSATLTRAGGVAQVASGGSWKTTITLLNVSSAQAEIKVAFWADDGSALSLPFTVTVKGVPQTMTASSLDQMVPANGTLLVETEAPGSSTLTGWAEVFSSAPVTGYAIFRQHGQTGIDSEGTVPLDRKPLASVLLPYDNTAGYATGVAIANLSAGPVTVSAILRDESGAQLSTQSLSLSAHGHTSFAFADLFGVTAGKRGFAELTGGTMEGISVVGLRFSPASSFTSIPELSRQ